MNYNDVIINYRVIFEDVITPPGPWFWLGGARFWLSFGSVSARSGSILAQFGSFWFNLARTTPILAWSGSNLGLKFGSVSPVQTVI